MTKSFAILVRIECMRGPEGVMELFFNDEMLDGEV